MDLPAEFRRVLLELDANAARLLWGAIAPHLPQPATDAEVFVTLHHARTQAQSLPWKARAYSHAWLTDRGLPSGLPDELKPKAERLYGRVVQAVGISVKARNPDWQPAAAIIERAMADAVEEAHADGRLADAAFVKARMEDARKRTIDKLLR